MNSLSYTLFGIIAVLVGFCAWASIRLRAARIKAIRDQAANELLKADLARLKEKMAGYNSQIVTLNDNAGKMADMMAEYKVKAEVLEAESQMRSDTITGFIKEVEELRSAQNRLIECIQHTGIRGRDGVVRKATKEQIEQMKQGLSGMNEPSKHKCPTFPEGTSFDIKCPDPLPELETREPARDWSVPQAFPEGYKVNKGVEVELIVSDHYIVPIGSKGVTEEKDAMPYIAWEEEKYILGSGKGRCAMTFMLAPVNPTDHPEHPQFKK